MTTYKSPQGVRSSHWQPYCLHHCSSPQPLHRCPFPRAFPLHGPTKARQTSSPWQQPHRCPRPRPAFGNAPFQKIGNTNLGCYVRNLASTDARIPRTVVRSASLQYMLMSTHRDRFTSALMPRATVCVCPSTNQRCTPLAELVAMVGFAPPKRPPSPSFHHRSRSVCPAVAAAASTFLPGKSSQIRWSYTECGQVPTDRGFDNSRRPNTFRNEVAKIL